MLQKRNLQDMIREAVLPDKLVKINVSQVTQGEKNGINQSVDNNIDPDIFEFNI
jgi:hypothetical protein